MKCSKNTFLSFVLALVLLLSGACLAIDENFSILNNYTPDCGCNGPEDCPEGMYCDLDAAEDFECKVINGCEKSTWSIKDLPQDKCIGRCVEDKIQGSSCGWIEAKADQCGGWCLNEHPRAVCMPSGDSVSECRCAIPCETDNDCFDDGVRMVVEDCRDRNYNRVLCEPCKCKEGVCQGETHPTSATFCGDPSDCNC